jgi:hypothetical protein
MRKFKWIFPLIIILYYRLFLLNIYSMSFQLLLDFHDSFANTARSEAP